MKYAILSCSGMDKAEGSFAREVAIRLAEKTGGEIICPVLLNRTPARYKKLLAEGSLVLIDGCGTRCAGKLAAALEAKAERKLVIADALKARGVSSGTSLRLTPEEVALADAIATELLVEAQSAPEALAAVAGVGWKAPEDFVVVVHDKYEFRIPKTEYFFNENDVWARVAGSRARVGISDYMQQRLTDINYFDPPVLGATIEQFGEVGEVESTKAVFELVSPVGGVVTAVNNEVAQAPELINEDPYGRGWLAELELTSWEEDKELLIGGDEYAKTVERKAEKD
jgi:glycine cleavage system H protein